MELEIERAWREAGLGEPRSLMSMLRERTREPERLAVVHKQQGAWVEVTWGEVLAEVQALSAGLVSLGVGPGDRVALFGGTTLRYLLCDLAVSAAGGVSVPIYASNTAEECRHILHDSGAVVVLVDHDESDGRQPGRLSRLRARLADCPAVRHLVLFEGTPGSERELLLEQVRRRGQEAHAADPGDFERRLASVKPEDLSTLIYTSGTTGAPKGVMQTHAGWAYQGLSMRSVGVFEEPDSVMLFLPFAHVFGHLIKSSWLAQGFRLVFAESQEKVLESLARTGPTVLPTVPRLIEKLYSAVVGKGSTAPGLKGWLFRWALRQTLPYIEARRQGRTYSSPSLTLARRLVLDKVGQALRKQLGGHLRRFVTGSAPMSATMGYTLELLGFEVLEGYGLTESTGVATVNPPRRVRIGTVGLPLPGTEVKLAEDGEILLRGPALMRGYFNNPTGTAEVLPAGGWLRTGDIGVLDEQGYVRITDRKKDLLITAGGKNVAPQPLENQLKACPLISQAMVYGDRRPYLTALLTVSEEPARKLLAERGVSVSGYAELATHPEIAQAIQQAVDALNANLPPYSTLKRFVLLEHDLSQEAGDLTPTSKVKRKHLNQKYAKLLDGLYEERLLN